MATQGPTRATQQTNTWSGRPGIARVLRLTAYLGPTLASLATTFYLSRSHPPDRYGLPSWQWWIGVFLIGIAVLLIIDRLARRLLPLAALYRLSLAFPDEAPNRFGVAMRTGTTRQVQRRIEEFKANGIVDEELSFAEVMLELVASLSVHDRMTRGHCERVRAYTDMLIEELNIGEADAGKLRWAALLHDVGKLHVPSEILNKDGRPDNREWELLKSHTWQGDRMIEPIRGWLGEWADTVGSHHERWDGDGYPAGLAGNDIALGARIVAVADAFDVMTSTRSYKKPIKAEDARAEIARCAGTQFDPKVVRAFLNIGIGRLRFAIGPLSWAANVPAAGQAPIAPAITPVATFATAAVVTTVAGFTGGLFGLLTPEGEAPEQVAFVDEEPAAPSTTLSSPTTTTIVVTTTEATTTTTLATTTSGPATTQVATTQVATTAQSTTSQPTTTQTTSTTTAPIAAPIALSATEATDEDAVVAINLQAIGSGNLAFAISSQPAQGTVTLPALALAGGALPSAAPQAQQRTALYQPDADWNGTDSFSFTACETSSPFRCSTGNVTTNVASQNDPPTLNTVGTIQVAEDTATSSLDAAVLAAATDIDGDSLSVQWGVPSLAGTVTTTPSGVTYQAPNNYYGPLSYPYQLCDGTTCVGGSLIIEVSPVNDAPVVSALSLTSIEDMPRTIMIADLLAGSIADPDDLDSALVLSYSIVGGGGVLDTSIAGQVTFTPVLDYSGPVWVDVTACDPDLLCSTATLTVTVLAINDNPVAEDLLVAINEDQTKTIGSIKLFPKVADVDNADSSLSWTFQPTPDATFTNVTAQSFDVTPLQDATADIEIDYTVCDPILACDSGVITITIAPLNDDPIADAFTMVGTEDQNVSVNTTKLRANAADVDHFDTDLTWTFSAGTGTLLNVTSTSFVYKPVPDANGDVPVNYTVCDPLGGCDSNVITMSLASENDAPTIAPVANQLLVAGLEITPIPLAIADVDHASNLLTITHNLPSGLSIDLATFEIVGTPEVVHKDTSGSFTIDVEDPDGASDSAVVNIEFAPLAVSKLAGDIAITEVLYAQVRTATLTEVGVHDEFIEITNLNTTDTLAIAGLRLQDFDPVTGVQDQVVILGNVANTSFLYDIPANDDRGPTAVHNGTSVLAPGESAVIWMGDPDRDQYTVTGNIGGFPTFVTFYLNPFPHAPGEAREYEKAGRPWPTLDNLGDDIWLLDANGDIVDFVAWDSGVAGSEFSGQPASYLEQWQNGGEAGIAEAPPGQSISLGSAADADDTTCWAFTTQPNDPACGDPHLTIDDDPFSFGPTERVTSVGHPNFN